MSALNPPQLRAVRHLDGPLLVLAGAGSGKTRVITHKIAYLVGPCGMDPRHIAAITFTNKAAREMAARVSSLLEGKSPRGLTVSTFHSLGLAILRQEARSIGYKPNFSILDAADSFAVLADIAKTPDKSTLKALQGRISRWKNALVAPEEAARLAEAGEENDAAAARAYALYEQTLRAYQAVDFDDLICLPVRLFARDGEALERWQNRLRYLLVDEYQDTNLCQYELLKRLAGSRAAFTAVGDDDQAIYAWRGASLENLERLTHDYSNLTVIKLEQNYRSTVRILRAANTLIQHNTKLFAKTLWSDLGLGHRIEVLRARDEEAEAENIVMRIEAHRLQHRKAWRDYAILYRGNHQARPFEEVLRAHRIPYQLSGGQSFFERSEIKDIGAYLRLLHNSDDDPAFIRAATTPKRGIGTTTLQKLGEYAAQRHISLFAAVWEAGFAHRVQPAQLKALTDFCHFIQRMEYRAAREPAGELLSELVRAIGYEAHLFDSEDPRVAERRWNNVQEFIAWIARKGEEEGKRLGELAQTIALLSMLEGRDDDGDAVRLSTLHAAKGLEFPHVYLAGLEEGLLPHRESIEQGGIEEERRLLYVGITRARETLTLSYCARRRRAREFVVCEPSRFLAELPRDELLLPDDPIDPAAAKATASAQLANLKALLRR